jgi:ribosome-associated heat shock protein Hsp15
MNSIAVGIMTGTLSLRIDKFLWAVRIYKTRSLATEACNGNKVKIEGKSIKPSRQIKTGEMFTVTQRYITRTYKVLNLVEKRVSAKVLPQFIEDLTPQEELDKLKMERFTSYVQRYKGAGRPTKKERRLMNKFRL